MQKIMQITVYKTDTGLKVVEEKSGYDDDVLISDVVNIPMQCRVIMQGEQINSIAAHGLKVVEMVNNLYSTARLSNGEYLRFITHVHNVFRQPITVVK
ncbi:MAG: hypothetical protein IT249_09465 [Chitinophagaceae bacterium]|nr:hypothetical protein [Chitinophagaceae bacterium]